MKLSKQAKEFLGKTKGDKSIRKLLNLGGREGAKKDFFEILKRASKPSTS